MRQLTFGEIEQVNGGLALQQWLQGFVTASEARLPVVDTGSVD